jgi:hypothetical protein
MNVITIELCAEDRARLDRLAAALEKASPDCAACARSVAEGVAKFVANAELPATCPDNATETADVDPAPVAHPADDVAPWEDPAPVTAPKAEVSLSEFQKALSLRCAESDTMRAKVRALLHEYAEAASKVPADKRAEVLDRLAAL